MATPSIVAAAGALNLQGVQTFAFDVTLDFTLTDAGGNPIPWSDVSGYACTVYDKINNALPALAPTVASPQSGQITLSWTGAQTKNVGIAGRSYSLSFAISGYTYDVLAGSFQTIPPGSPGGSTSTTSSVSVSLGATTASVSVGLGGIGPGVLSLSAADSSITVGGTASEPTVAVDTSVIATVADVTDETNRAEAAEAKLLPLAGGTMTGALTLAGDPTQALQPATKQYVDALNLVPNGKSGWWLTPDMIGDGGGNSGGFVGQAICYRWPGVGGLIVKGMGLTVGTTDATVNVELGIYASDGGGGLPGTLLASCSLVPSASGFMSAQFAAPITLPDQVWVAFYRTAGAATFRIGANSLAVSDPKIPAASPMSYAAWLCTTASGALPSSFGTGEANNGFYCPRLYVEID